MHDSAHATDHVRPNVPDHPLIPAGEATLIDTQEALDAFLSYLSTCTVFAYDTEFIGELTYRPQLCLIQIATIDQVGLIDPLADLDLSAFWALLCNPAIEKIVHAGDQDIEPIFRHTDTNPANILDTQIAAGFCALNYPVSLSKLVRGLLDVHLAKGLTFSEWDRRPLSPSQLSYAADDVRYLLAVRAEIHLRLQSLGHTDIVKSECQVICQEDQYLFDPDYACRRLRGASGLSARGLAIARELTAWRNSVAKDHDVPQRQVLADESIVDLARRPSKTLDELSRARSLSGDFIAEHGPQLVAATLAGIAVPEDQLPVMNANEDSPAEKFQIDSLWSLTEALCFQRGIDPGVVTSRAEIARFFRLLIGDSDLDDPATHPEPLRLLTGWRKTLIADELIKIYRTGKQIEIKWPNRRSHR